MMECVRFEASIQALIAGSPKLEELEELVEHCKVCRECRGIFEMHRTLTDLGSRFDELESPDLEGARMSVLEQLTPKSRSRSAHGWLAAFWSPFTFRPLTATALLVIVFVLGLAVSRVGERSGYMERKTADEDFLSESLRNLGNSPYTFSNVGVRYLDDNTISLSFDIAKRVEIIQPARSELVKGILTRSGINPAATGVVGHFRFN
jgi:hypothetical protein